MGQLWSAVLQYVTIRDGPKQATRARLREIEMSPTPEDDDTDSLILFIGDHTDEEEDDSDPLLWGLPKEEEVEASTRHSSGAIEVRI